MNKTVIVVILLVLAAQAGLYMAFFGNDNSGAQNQQPPAMAVSVKTLKKQPVTYKYESPGRVVAYRQSQVRPQVSGVITKSLFEQGTRVEKGQQLYQIDEAPFLAELNSAKATAKAAKSRLDRYNELVKIKAVSQQETDDVIAEYDQAKAALEVAQVNFDYTKVYAPISGYIGRTLVTDGALVTSNQAEPIAIITQLNPVYVDMQLSGDDVAQFRMHSVGMETIPVRVRLGGEKGSEYPITGKLKFSEVTVDTTTGAVAMRAIFDNPEGILLPGMFVRSVLELKSSDELLVPQRATTRMPDGSLVAWIVDESNKAQKRVLEVEQAYKDQWIVKGGVDVGDRLIMAGYQKVQPDMPVRSELWNPNGKAAQQAPAKDVKQPVEAPAPEVAEDAVEETMNTDVVPADEQLEEESSEEVMEEEMIEEETIEEEVLEEDASEEAAVVEEEIKVEDAQIMGAPVEEMTSEDDSEDTTELNADQPPAQNK